MAFGASTASGVPIVKPGVVSFVHGLEDRGLGKRICPKSFIVGTMSSSSASNNSETVGVSRLYVSQ